MKKHVFIDAEFTSEENPELLSMGLVCEDGQEHYVEILDLEVQSHANSFVQESVLPQWGLKGMQVPHTAALGAHVAQWLQGLDARELFICYDYHTDMDLLEGALALLDLSKYPKLLPTHVGYLLGDASVMRAMATSWRLSQQADHIARHHALADARALRAGFLDMHGPF